MSSVVMLYHGSSAVVAHPEAARNAGFSDLGRGFYLTDDREAAAGRARSRARKDGVAHGAVSAFAFDEDALPWVTLGTSEPVSPTDGPFGLCFAATRAGIEAWVDYVLACRASKTTVEGVGEPAVTRAWIATEELEMVASGYLSPAELAAYADPADLVVQYCFRDQRLIDDHLVFRGDVSSRSLVS